MDREGAEKRLKPMKHKVIALAFLWLIFAALLLYLASMIAGRVNEVSRPDKLSIYVRVTTEAPR